ncbi:MAG: HK97 family phage prohead protease [Chloroflexi bacterium]|nr:HK97 family phage prohead protease [Chloroflexota bacterium]
MAQSPRGMKVRVVGYASVFHTLSHPKTDPSRGAYRALVRPGAFSHALERVARGYGHVTANVGHDDRRMFASTDDGSLVLGEDAVGLWFAARIRSDAMARQALLDMQAERMTASSMRYLLSPACQHWRRIDGELVCEIERFEQLDDVCIAPAGNFPRATVRLVDDRVERRDVLFSIREQYLNWSGRTGGRTAGPNSPTLASAFAGPRLANSRPRLLALLR